MNRREALTMFTAGGAGLAAAMASTPGPLQAAHATPLAMGERFVNRNEWAPLVANRWIDFTRIHISAADGLNMVVTRRTRREHAPRPGRLQLRRPGAESLLQQARSGRGYRREARRQVPYKTLGGSRGDDRRMDGTIVRP